MERLLEVGMRAGSRDSLRVAEVRVGGTLAARSAALALKVFVLDALSKAGKALLFFQVRFGMLESSLSHLWLRDLDGTLGGLLGLELLAEGSVLLRHDGQALFQLREFLFAHSVDSL